MYYGKTNGIKRKMPERGPKGRFDRLTPIPAVAVVTAQAVKKKELEQLYIFRNALAAVLIHLTSCPGLPCAEGPGKKLVSGTAMRRRTEKKSFIV